MCEGACNIASIKLIDNNGSSQERWTQNHKVQTSVKHSSLIRNEFSSINFLLSLSTNKFLAIAIKSQYLPPTTRHERITSSPSSIGPIVVLFIMRPQRSKIIGFSGRTGKTKAKALNVIIMICFIVHTLQQHGQLNFYKVPFTDINIQFASCHSHIRSLQQFYVSRKRVRNEKRKRRKHIRPINFYAKLFYFSFFLPNFLLVLSSS
jgi:hypothetical protein